MSLTDLLDDLVRSQPAPDPALAAAAWQEGRRRRRTARVRVLAVAAAVAGLLVVVLPGAVVSPVAPFAGGGATAVVGHPERIGRQWWVRDLPDRPGPVAALLQAVQEQRTSDEPDGWYAVRADGHRWRLPEVSHRTDLWPALSDDGRLLGRLATPAGPYVVHNLVTGERTSFEGIVDPGGREDRAGLLGSQSPAHFSPDGRMLWLPSALGRTMLLDVAIGSWRELPEGLGKPAGWAGQDRLVWLHGGGDGSLGSAVPLRARTTDATGATVADVELGGTSGVFASQWAGSVSKGGGEVAVTTTTAFSAAPLGVTRYALGDGSPRSAFVPVDANQPCSTTWSAGALVVPVQPPDSAVVVQDVVDGAPVTVTVAAPQIGARCLVWAADALDGPARGGGLVGTSEAGWTWWWREVLLAGVALVVAGVLLVVRRRRPPVV